VTSLPDRFRVCAAEDRRQRDPTRIRTRAWRECDIRRKEIFARAPFRRMSRAAANNCRNCHTTAAKTFRQNIPATRRVGIRASRRNGPSVEVVHGRMRASFSLFFVDEMQLLGNIARPEQQDAFTRQTVASGASGLLVIALQIFRQIVKAPQKRTFVLLMPFRTRCGVTTGARRRRRNGILMFVRSTSLARVIRLRANAVLVQISRQ